MRKPVLLFVLKCIGIVYFFASPSITVFTSKNNIAAQVTKGNWKVSCNDYTDANCILKDYTFTFSPSGKLSATKANVTFEGFWAVDVHNKKINISFKNNGTALDILNHSWNITATNNDQISFEKNEVGNYDKMYITAL
jgi:hypothetical protein